jgi:hypothetical protein
MLRQISTIPIPRRRIPDETDQSFLVPASTHIHGCRARHHWPLGWNSKVSDTLTVPVHLDLSGSGNNIEGAFLYG